MANLDLLNLFWKRTEQEAPFRRYSAMVRQVRPFSLVADLAEVASQLADTSEKTLRSYLHSARLPFPIMWLECDHALAMEHIGRPADGWRLHEADPIRVGWLIMESPPGTGRYTMTRVSSLVDPDDGQVKANLSPVIQMWSADVRLDVTNGFTSLTGQVDPEILRAIRTINAEPTYSRMAWRDYSSPTEELPWRIDDALEEEARKSPLYQTNVALLEPRTLELCVKPITPDQSTIYERAVDMLFAGMVDQKGELGFVVAALALMNELPVRYVPYRPSGNLRTGGRLRPYMSSSIVSLEVPATRRRIKDIQKHLKHAGEAAKRARHEVRGHWRHAKTLPRYEDNHHRWERHYDPITEEPQGWRMWIPNHERGDANLGWVKQSYNVHRGRGEIPRPPPEPIVTPEDATWLDQMGGLSEELAHAIAGRMRIEKQGGQDGGE